MIKQNKTNNNLTLRVDIKHKRSTRRETRGLAGKVRGVTCGVRLRAGGRTVNNVGMALAVIKPPISAY